LNEGKIVRGEPVVAPRYPTTLFDPAEEPLDLVASAVEIGAEADRIAAIAFRRDVDPRTLLHGKLSDPVGVIAAVGRRNKEPPADE
jgi:hypothetical protein